MGSETAGASDPPPPYRLPLRKLWGFGVAMLLVLIATQMDPFMPSPQVAWLGPVIVLLALAASAALVVFLHGWPPRLERALGFGNNLFQVVVAVAFFFIAHAMLRFFVPSLLHQLAPAQAATQIESVEVRLPNRRSCRRMAVLPDDGFLLHRRLCSLSKQEFDTLRHHRHIELRGSRSYFGFRVEDYAAVSPPAR